ncbi:MAG: LacI family DNA-binding transcriptional regulator [Sphaerochaetaceae bacterium]|nr:LacI family transcriptional regulator [Sphaerochaetaceae bacterium]NLO61339.1 LacI family transcriptional regulator [Spirochaetales bacterium]MDD2406889.1 LacI family DNA-binding transcriptional regulator [Sphaerochaetaceae bacterium]MDD4259806.1 LacI family DNA-binding transcriptional regulator [Sphaerochaetaceae bacterium]MDD4762340.1 LacI family DNA-binding transcriptional regulator [Sphaerochaetaceae bacterium]
MSRRSRRVTMKDIAEATGFTVNTVSHALKDLKDISEETKKVIRQKAREMGYLTNLVAVSMRSGKTNTLAIIIPDIGNPFFATKVKEMDALLRDNGYSSIIINTDENSEKEYESVRMAISRKVDGIIICPTQTRTDIFDLMIENSIPYVVIGRKFSGHLYYSVVWDDVRAGYLATEHLVRQGKKRILYLNGPPHISSSNDRLAGYKLCLEKHGIGFDEKLVTEADIVETLGCNCIYSILEKQVVFDAIFAFSDFIAFAAVATLHMIGVDVPVVGVDDILSDLNLPVKLSSVGVRKDNEAHAIIKMLFEQMKDAPTSTPHIVVIETFLVNRDN